MPGDIYKASLRWYCPDQVIRVGGIHLSAAAPLAHVLNFILTQCSTIIGTNQA